MCRSGRYLEADPYMRELYSKFRKVIYERSDLSNKQKDEIFYKIDRGLNPEKAVVQIVNVNDKPEEEKIVFGPRLYDDEYNLLIFER